MKKFLIVLFHVLFVAITLWHVNITISDYLANRFYTHDVGVVDYRIYHTTQGNFFFDVVQGRSGFGLHFQPSLLLLLPFHMVLRHILFLPLLQTLALASAAWAVAWLTSLLIQRDRENGESGGLTVAGMLAGWIFLTNPHVGSIFLAHHYDSITAALGLWALAFLASGRRWVFWVLLLIALGLKEDGPVHWFVFAPWWLLWGWKANGEGFAEGWRKRLGFSIRLAVVCTVFAFVALLVIMWTAHSDGYEALFFAKRYTGAEDAQRPFFATVFGPLWQMGKLLLPFFAFLPLAAPSTLLLLVAPAYQMGLAEEAQQNLLYYYSYAFMPFLGLGTALGLRRIAGLLQRLDHARLRRSIKCGGAVLLFLLGAWMLTMETRTAQRHRWPADPQPRHSRIRRHLRESIPSDAPVVAQFDLFPQVPYRTAIYPLGMENIEKGKYLVLDLKGDIGDARPEAPAIMAWVQSRLETGRARIIVQDDRFFIIENLAYEDQKEGTEAASGNNELTGP